MAKLAIAPASARIHALARLRGHQRGAQPGISRIEAGRIAEMWVEWDNLAALTQLGHFAPPAAPGGAALDTQLAIESPEQRVQNQPESLYRDAQLSI